MDIKADLWFPTVVWNYQLKQINNAELRDYVINFRQEDPGKRASNYGGWQSRNIDILDERPLNVEKFIVALQQNVDAAAKMAGLPSFLIFYKVDKNREVIGFRIKQLTPKMTREKTIKPGTWVNMMELLKEKHLKEDCKK